MAKQTFRKQERLYSKNDFENLFTNGKSFILNPFKVFWLKENFKSLYPVKFGISVPKKNFKLAVKRNKIKRQIREAYRKNKWVLYDSLNSNNLKILMAVVHISKEEKEFKEVENKIKEAIGRLIKEHG